MAGRLAMIVIATFISVAGAACSSTTTAAGHGQLPAKSTPAHSGTLASPARPSRSSQPAWPERRLLREGVAERTGSQVIDPATDSAYVLTSRTRTPVRGPWVLRRIDARTGSHRRGPTFSVGGIAMAAGYLWIYGVPRASSVPIVWQVDPATLARVRSVALAALPPQFPGLSSAVSSGPGGSAWIGSNRTLLRVSASTGKQLARVTLPAGLLVSGIAADPGGKDLYVSAAHLVSGGMEGGVVLEYDARTGRQLAMRSRGLISYSAAGAWLTAVPGGVWASFRTGMTGLTVHMSQRNLRMIAPPGPRIALRPATGVFHWIMYETTVYGGALWLANQVGILACLDPRTGRVLASERVSQSQLISGLAVDQARRTIVAMDSRGLASITPPRLCWR